VKLEALKPTIPVKPVSFGKIITESYDHIVIGAGAAGLVSAERAASLGQKVLIIEKSDRLGGNADSMKLANGMLVPKGSSVFGPGAHPQTYDYVTRNLGIPLSHFPVYPGYVMTAPNKRLSFDPLAYSSIQERTHAQDITEFARQLRKKLSFPNGARKDLSIRDNPELLRYDVSDPVKFFAKEPSTIMNLIKPWSRSDLNAPYDHVSPLGLMFDVASYLQLDTTIMAPGGNHTILKAVIDRLTTNQNVTILTHATILELKDSQKGKHPVQLRVKDGLGNERNLIAKKAHIASGPRSIPTLLPHLPAEQIQTLKTAFIQEPYIVVGLVLNSEKKGVPLLSSRFVFSESKAGKYIADATLINALYDQNMPVGAKVPSVFVCYAPIPPAEWANPPSVKKLVKSVVDEALLHIPELKKTGITGVYFKYYPRAILAPRPGDVRKVTQIPEQLTPNIRWIDAASTGLTSSFTSALHGALRAFDDKK